MRCKMLSMLLALCMIGVALVSLASVSKAADNYRNSWTTITLNNNNYPNPDIPGNWYAPGDTITGYLQGYGVADGQEDNLDVVVQKATGGGCPVVQWAELVSALNVNNVTLNATTGQGSFIFGADKTQYLSDGAYCAFVMSTMYIETGGTGATYDWYRFEIHLYWIDASFDRDAYVPGDTVKVYYLVSYVKDNSLVTNVTFAGEWMGSIDGTAFDKQALIRPNGSFSFTILTTGGVNPGTTYPVFIWYNGTAGGMTRTYEWTRDARVGTISVSIDTPTSFAPPYAPGSLLEVDISVDVTASFWSYRYAGAAVTISLLNGPRGDSPGIPGYISMPFTSDANGEVKYMLVLTATTFVSGNSYAINTTATRILKSDTDWVAFSVKSVPQAMTVRVTFDKVTYYSGDTGLLTALAQPPVGHNMPSTYKYTMTPDSSIPPTFVLAKISSSQPTFAFAIPTTFEGYLYFDVEAANSNGDFGSTQAYIFVEYGVIMVNPDPLFYNANSQVNFNAQLQSTAITRAGPITFFYTIFAYPGGHTVTEGAVDASGSAGSYSATIPFSVPAVPAEYYTIQVMVNEAGHIIEGEGRTDLIHGFIMTLKFDKTSYNPGDTMTVDYEIKPLVEGTPMPRVYYLSFGLAGLPSGALTTTQSSGSFKYKVTDNSNTGDQIFFAQDSSTQAYVDEVVLIGTPEGTIGGIELFDAFLLVLVVILFLLMLAFRFRGAPSGAAAAPKPKEEKTAPPPPPGQAASPMIVNCKACGAPIEITTSKRPIEVMCPSCGETAMVQ